MLVASVPGEAAPFISVSHGPLPRGGGRKGSYHTFPVLGPTEAVCGLEPPAPTQDQSRNGETIWCRERHVAIFQMSYGSQRGFLFLGTDPARLCGCFTSSKGGRS